MYVIEDLHAEREKEDTKRLLESSDGSVEFVNVDIVTPGDVCITQDLSFKVLPSKSLVVTGPNASGKSSLFRTLGAFCLSVNELIDVKRRTLANSKWNHFAPV